MVEGVLAPPRVRLLTLPTTVKRRPKMQAMNESTYAIALTNSGKEKGMKGEFTVK